MSGYNKIIYNGKDVTNVDPDEKNNIINWAFFGETNGWGPFIVEDNSVDEINTDNGESTVMGDALANGATIVVQGLKMFLNAPPIPEDMSVTYVKCESTDTYALEVVANDVTPTTKQVNISTVTNTGLSVVIGDYVKNVKESYIDILQSHLYTKWTWENFSGVSSQGEGHTGSYTYRFYIPLTQKVNFRHIITNYTGNSFSYKT